MGLAALGNAIATIDTGQAASSSPTVPMIENDIRSLLNAPRDGGDAPSLELLEHTLTAGYARAMALEAEQSRLQRRIADVAMQLAEGGGSASSELQRLGERLQEADSELGRLRGLLASLRSRAADVRTAA